jgi:GNAT superfamily N-acetyltransferase
LQVIKPLPEHVFAWSELAKQFVAEGLKDYEWGLNEEDLHTTYHLWDKENWGFLLEDKGKIVGCLAGIINQHFFDYSNNFFHEYMWYVKPDFRGTGGGIKLYRALERRCNERGIKRIVMGHTSYMAQDFEKLYKKLGFTYLQSHYEKVLNGNK